METALGGGGEATTNTGAGAPATGGTTGGSTTAGTTTSTGTSTGGTGSWRDALPEEIRTHSSLSSFTDIGSFAKSFIHAQGLVGKKGVVPPSDWSKITPEEKQAYFQQLGVPSADKYSVEVPKDYKMPEAVMSQFKETAINAGLLPHQANEILNWYSKFESDSMKGAQIAQESAHKQQLDNLKKEWGEGWDKNIATANLFIKEKGGEEAAKFMKQNPQFGNNPVIIKLLTEAGKMMGEDKLREGGVGDGRMTPDDIRMQMDEIRGNAKNNGYFDSTHPMHSVTLKKMESLGRQLTGGR